MSGRKNWKSIVGCLGAVMIVGCGVDGDGTIMEDADGVEETGAVEREEADQTSVATQALGSVSHNLPDRGNSAAVTTRYLLGTGMVTSIRSRTTGLVTALSVDLYQPSKPNNTYTIFDPQLTRGPVGGDKGTLSLPLQCGSGSAAIGLYGRADEAIDALGLVCASIDTATGHPRTESTPITQAPGGTGGKPFRDTCGEGKWLTGISVGVGSWGSTQVIRSVRGRCSNAR